MNRTMPTAADNAVQSWRRALCATLGDGYVPATAPDGLPSIRTPDQGRISLRAHASEIELIASEWPTIDELGFRRRYSRELSIRVSAQREITASAQDIRRRLLQPYALALAQERRRAGRYLQQLRAIATCLAHAGFGPRERHIVGRSVQAQKPHGVLEDQGLRLPTTSTTSVTPHEESAVAAVEVRGLSLDEVEAMHVFLDQLVARRAPTLRLCA